MPRYTNNDSIDRTSVEYDAVIVGSGPNGLAAAITLAQAGWKTLVIEARDIPGGGSRSGELTLPGFTHDICSSVHPLAVSSRFFRALPLEKYGLRWIYSPYAVTHPLDGGRVIAADRSLDITSRQFGPDRQVYNRIMGMMVDNYQDILDDIHGPFPIIPHHPVKTARFGLYAIQSAARMAERQFDEGSTRAFFAGHSAHSILPLEWCGTAAAGLLIGSSAHAAGWPVAEGGSQAIVNSMIAHLESLGGEIQTSWEVRSLDELPTHQVVLLDLTPKGFIQIAGDRLPTRYRKSLEKFKYGAGIFKIDYALDGPIPWINADCLKSITVHVGGNFYEICQSEAVVGKGEHAERPFVLLVQPTLFDPTRAPSGKHIAWTYCHVPNSSTRDMTNEIESQIERFAPGFKDLILARHITNSTDLEEYNPNYVGGDISAGRQDLYQQFARPVPSLKPYRTPLKGIYLCSSSTPPGGGVHGMCGYQAARLVLKDLHQSI